MQLAQQLDLFVTLRHACAVGSTAGFVSDPAQPTLLICARLCGPAALCSAVMPSQTTTCFLQTAMLHLRRCAPVLSCSLVSRLSLLHPHIQSVPLLLPLHFGPPCCSLDTFSPFLLHLHPQSNYFARPLKEALNDCGASVDYKQVGARLHVLACMGRVMGIGTMIRP